MTVEYGIPRGLHRGQHLLLTLHSADGTADMLLSQAFEDAPEAARRSFAFPVPKGDCLVYGSVFNFFGQRSDPEHVVAEGEARGGT